MKDKRGKMFRIGLTGSICTGKTFVLSIFKELGYFTIRADDIAKNIIFSDRKDVIKRIVEVFGEEVYDKRTGIKKEEFSRMMFDDPEKRDFISRYIHPMVAAERKNIFRDLEKSGLYEISIYESALLVESGIYKEFDRVIVVYTSEEEQIRRLTERDHITPEEALKKIKAQFPISEKLKAANFTVNTTGSFDETRNKTMETIHLLRQDLKLT